MSKTLEKRIGALEAEHRPDVARAGLEIMAMLKASELGFDALTPAEKALLSDDRIRELMETYDEYVRNRYKGVETHG